MEKRVLYTTSFNEIIESTSNLCGCCISDIMSYLKCSQPFVNISVTDINIITFFKKLGIQFSSKNELFEIIKFDSVVISHLTTRTSLPNKSNIYCLNKALLECTDISEFLADNGITFRKVSGRLETYYKNQIVDWDGFESSITTRIKHRLRTSGKYVDNCINGFLFNHLFWEDSNVEHIIDCPEIILDICYVLNRQDIINQWRNISTSYALGFLSGVNNISFDNYALYKTVRSKNYLIYKYILYYLVQVYHGVWNSKYDNPIIRLKDNCSVSKENILGFYKIDR